MSLHAGKDVLLKLASATDPLTYMSVAGLRMKTIALNARTVDATHADSPEGWRELLGGCGVKTCSITGAGLFTDSEADARIRALFFSQALADWQIIIPDFARFTGPFLIASLDYSGRYDAEAAWSMTLSSAGALATEML